mmetsp:Transcript_102278/g.327932  ORF Transcript_102278/g.327932 Transcript_102278/m.327932 type:complete len:433 (-) Transcript_102278:10-1308(-)
MSLYARWHRRDVELRHLCALPRGGELGRADRGNHRWRLEQAAVQSRGVVEHPTEEQAIATPLPASREHRIRSLRLVNGPQLAIQAQALQRDPAFLVGRTFLHHEVDAVDAGQEDLLPQSLGDDRHRDVGDLCVDRHLLRPLCDVRPRGSDVRAGTSEAAARLQRGLSVLHRPVHGVPPAPAEHRFARRARIGHHLRDLSLARHAAAAANPFDLQVRQLFDFHVDELDQVRRIPRRLFPCLGTVVVSRRSLPKLPSMHLHVLLSSRPQSDHNGAVPAAGRVRQVGIQWPEYDERCEAPEAHPEFHAADGGVRLRGPTQSQREELSVSFFDILSAFPRRAEVGLVPADWKRPTPLLLDETVWCASVAVSQETERVHLPEIAVGRGLRPNRRVAPRNCKSHRAVCLMGQRRTCIPCGRHAGVRPGPRHRGPLAHS